MPELVPGPALVPVPGGVIIRDTSKKTGPVDNPSILYAIDKKTGKPLK